jgi:YggT family protein
MVLSIFLSWIPDARSSKFGILIGRMTDWYLGYFGNFLVLGNIDFTPVLGLIAYEFIINLIWLV